MQWKSEMVIHSQADLCYCMDIKCVAWRSKDRRKVGEDKICKMKCVFVSSFLLSSFCREFFHKIKNMSEKMYWNIIFLRIVLTKNLLNANIHWFLIQELSLISFNYYFLLSEFLFTVSKYLVDAIKKYILKFSNSFVQYIKKDKRTEISRMKMSVLILFHSYYYVHFKILRFLEKILIRSFDLYIHFTMYTFLEKIFKLL